jgi:predicted O-methyltransferase YrrM
VGNVIEEQPTWAAVDEYLVGLLVGEDEALTSTLKANVDAGLPSIDVAPTQGKLLMLIARLSGARSVLELGTLGGYSTIWLARGLPEDGRVVTLEAVPEHAEVARGNVDRAGVGGRVDIRVGAALDTLPKLEAEQAGPFDVVFIDADKVNYPHYLEWALKLTRPGSVIIGDNVVRKGHVVDDDSDDENVRATRSFLELAATDPRLDATALQTVGTKGWDGLLLALVR